ncbi:siderophore-interacting protein [Propionibacteriaceae bacterium G1746]|uniref:siderophore-interacting protein n=1 Tax=Aestuariimicrobium sp. G57 TaxID=3418485 RepID=UPI003C18605E
MANQRTPKPVVELTVSSRETLSSELVRLWLAHERFEPSEHTDSYVKLLFDDHGPLAAPPADDGPRAMTRTYTVRAHDAVANELALDFVVHGDEGLAAPWAVHCQPGDRVLAYGPGGAWSPAEDADFHLFVGDASALPAIAAGLERLQYIDSRARGLALIEVHHEGVNDLVPPAGVEVRWVVRGDEPYREERLADEVAALDWTTLGDVSVFAHGERGAMKALRRLFTQLQVPRERLSLSGYWALGRVEDEFQAEKRTEVGKV